MRTPRLLALHTLAAGSVLLLAACQAEKDSTPTAAQAPSSASQSGQAGTPPAPAAASNSTLPQAGPTTSTPATPEASTTGALLTIETPASGEITSRSPLNRNDGSRYAVIPVRLAPNSTTRISLDGPLRGKLTLFDGHKVLASSYAACCTPAESPVHLVVHSANGGEFELGVSGMDANSFGPFEVKAQASDLRRGGELKMEETVTGWFNPSEGGNRHTGHVYTVNVTEAGLHEFILRSQDFDAYLTLSGMGLSLEDDDGGGNNDARLIAQLEPGRYELRAAAYGGQGAGSYVLSSSVPRTPPGLEVQQSGRLALDANIAGIVTGQPLFYDIELDERRRLIVDMKSDTLDSYLRLQGNGLDISDDDSGTGQDARLNVILEPGRYVLEAHALGNANGIFTLSIQSQDAPEQQIRTIQRGYAGEGHLNPGAPDLYQLTVEETGNYVIYLGSSDFDAMLTLSGHGVQVSDDDGGQNFDSRLAIQLEPGVYTITVGSVGPNSGHYRLTVE